MIVAEKIQQSVQKLPLPLQHEVYDYVEYLLSKRERAVVAQSELDWSEASLSLAMRGMENEDGPVYTSADLKVVFA